MNSQDISTGETIFYYDASFIENGISLAGNPLTKITVSKSAVYEIWYSIQLQRTQQGNDAFAYIWPKINGIDVPFSNGRVNINSNNSDSLPIVPYIFDLSSTNYVEFASSASVQHVKIGGITGTPGPDIPSIIVGIKEIG
jgi:hypothetical protein